MVRHQHAEQQSAQIGLHADLLEQRRPHDGGGEETEERQQLAMADPVQQIAQGRPQEEQADQSERPDRGQRAGRSGQEGHGEDVLDDQDTDRRAPMQRPHLALVLKHLHREDGAGEAEREGDQQRRARIERGEDREPGRGQQHQAGRQHDHRDRGMQAGAGPDFRPRQGFELELQADHEEQQGDAEIGDVADRRVLADPETAEREARAKEPDHGRKADGPGQKAQEKGHGDGNRKTRQAGDRIHPAAFSLTVPTPLPAPGPRGGRDRGRGLKDYNPARAGT